LVWDGYSETPEIQHAYAATGFYTAIVRVTDDDGAQSTAVADVALEAQPNSAPQAALSATPSEGFAPLTVEFDGSASSDADGFIVLYEWDFNGDGAWDSYGANPTASFSYFGPGTFEVGLRVTDDDGETATATQTVQVQTGSPI
jgi:PKD repeat protein